MQLLWGYDDDKWQFTPEHPIVKRFSVEKNPAKTGPQNGGFSQKWGSKR